jgi:hypothetical protein
MLTLRCGGYLPEELLMNLWPNVYHCAKLVVFGVFLSIVHRNSQKNLSLAGLWNIHWLKP